MRPIHIAHLDKARPVLVLTREVVRPHLSHATEFFKLRTTDGNTTVAIDAANFDEKRKAAQLLLSEGTTVAF